MFFNHMFAVTRLFGRKGGILLWPACHYDVRCPQTAAE